MFIKKKNDIHNYNTKHENDYAISRFLKDIVKYSLMCVGSMVYTELTSWAKGSKTCSI